MKMIPTISRSSFFNSGLSIFFLSCLLLFNGCKDKSAEDDNPPEKEYPKSVTFELNGSSVTYEVIKMDYSIDHKGDSLETPVSLLWLDRNLGATRAATTKNDPMAAGDLFQWGRMDDGHQVRSSDTTQALALNAQPGHNQFIAAPLNSSDWLVVSDDQLWNGSTNANCPCPDGWRVPNIQELMMEMKSWAVPNMSGAYQSPLKWVAGGNRDNHGTERYTDSWALIWSSTIAPSGKQSAEQLVIIGDDVSEPISNPRIFGGSVRCVKDF